MMSATNFAVVGADGCFGAWTQVFSAHRTADAARKAAGPRYQVIEMAGARKGRRVHGNDIGRVYARVPPGAK